MIAVDREMAIMGAYISENRLELPGNRLRTAFSDCKMVESVAKICPK